MDCCIERICLVLFLFSWGIANPRPHSVVRPEAAAGAGKREGPGILAAHPEQYRSKSARLLFEVGLDFSIADPTHSRPSTTILLCAGESTLIGTSTTAILSTKRLLRLRNHSLRIAAEIV